MSTPTITLTFEEGTSGSSLTATGSYATVTSPAPIYSSTAALHGSLGCTTPSGGGSNAGPTFTVTRSGSFTNANKDCTVSIYVQPVSVPGGAVQLLDFQNSSNVNLGFVRVHSNGHFDIANSGGTSQKATTMSWSTGTWYRLDVQYTGSTNSVTVGVFAGTNVEGTTADESITATITSQTGGIDHWWISPGRSSTAACQLYVDTVRFYDGVVVPDPFGASSAFSGSGALSGSGTLTAGTGAPTMAATVALSGSGGLGAGTGLPALAATPTLTGSGVLGAVGPGTGVATGSGALSAGGGLGGSSATGLSGSGALSAVGGQSATVMLTFEEGTNGATLTAGGNYATVNGSPTYSTAAALHGSLGLAGTSASTSSPAFSVTRGSGFGNANHSCAVSIYVQPVTVSTAAITWLALQTSANTNLMTVRANASTGKFDLYAGSILAATSLSWATGTWYRLDLTYDGAAASVTLNVFAGTNVEGTTPDSTITAAAVAGTLDHWLISPARGADTVNAGYIDTVRIYDGAVTPAPYGSPAQAGSGGLSGSGTLSGAGAALATGQSAATSGTGLLTVGSTAYLGTGALSGSGTLAATGNDMVLLTFEEGTDGNALAAGGAISAVSTPAPTYSAAAALHGGLGLTGLGTSAGPTFTLPKPTAFADPTGSVTLSLYVEPIAVPGGAIQLVNLQTSANTSIGMVRINANSGKFDIASGSGAAQIATTTGWALSTRYRCDISYAGSSHTITLNLFAGANSEGSAPDATISWVSTATNTTLDHLLLSPARSSVANCQAYLDTVRFYDGLVTPGPYAPLTSSGLSGTGSLSAVGSSTGPVIMFTGSGVLAANTTPTVVHSWLGAPTVDGFTIKARTVGFTAPALQVSTSSSMTSPVTFTASTPDTAGYVVAAATGLSAGTRYYYQLTDTVGGTTSSVGTAGRARTLPTFGIGQSARIAFGSCITTNATDATALNDVVAWDPDLFIFLGDYDYVGDTSTDPNHQRATMESQALGAAGMSNLMASVPWTFAASDHDAGPDNGDSNNAYTAAHIVATKQMVPTYPLADTRSPTVGRYHSFTVGRVRFIVIDIRNTDRSPGANVDDATKTMLGATQKAWLKARLIDPEPVKVICSDVAWMGAASLTNGADKWWSYSTERQEISDYIAANNVKTLLWHGDSHALGVATPAKNTWGGFPVYCSSPMRNVGGGRNLSTFSAEYNNAGGSCAQYARVTITDNGSNITFAYSGWDASAGVERIAQTDVIPTPTVGALTGSGTLSGPPAGTAGLTGAPALSGSGGLGSTSTVTTAVAPALSGSGGLALSGLAAPAGHPALTGSGTLAASGGVKDTGVTTLPGGTGTLTVAANAGPRGLGALSGSGTLAGAGASGRATTVATSGVGTLAFATGISGRLLSAALSGAGTLGATGASGARPTASLVGSGALSVAPVTGAGGSGALTGSGALSATRLPGLLGAATLTGAGTLVASGTVGIIAIGIGYAVQLSGSGALSDSVRAGGQGGAIFTGAGALAVVGNYPTGTGIVGLRGSGVLAGSGALSTGTFVGEIGLATLGGPGSLSTGRTPNPIVTPALTGSGALGAWGPVVRTNLAADPAAVQWDTSVRPGFWNDRWAPVNTTFTLTSAAVDGPAGLSTYAKGTVAATGQLALGFHLTGNPETTNPGMAGFLPVTAGATYTFSVYIRTSVAGQTWKFGVRYATASSTWAAAQVIAPTAMPQGQWTRLTITATAPAGATAVAAYTCVLSGTAWSIGDHFEGSGLLIEQTSALGSYFDGSTTDTAADAYNWTGGVGTSASTDSPAALVGLSGGAGLSGSGSLTTGTLAAARGVVPFTGSGALSAATTPRPAGTATLTGGSSLVVSAPTVTRQVAVATTGSGTLVVSVIPAPAVGIYYSLTGAGTLVASGVYGFRPSITLTGTGALLTMSTPSPTRTTTLTGSGQLAAAPRAGETGAVSLAGVGVLGGVAALPSAVRIATFTGLGALAGTQTGVGIGVGLGATPFGTGPLGGGVGGRPGFAGIGTLATVDAVTLSGRANLAATGQLLSLARVTDSGIAHAFMVGTLSIPHQHGELLGADHPLWVDPVTAPPRPWARPAGPDLFVTVSHDPLRIRRIRVV